ncbi:MAG: membrane protein insertion efficiency factor YidD [Gammaproteobacteria bacterium]
MASKLLLFLLSIYQRGFSLLFGPTCRFYPSCSEYTRQAIKCHGPTRGIILGAQRICRCHPWHEGGYDPVPGTETQSQEPVG